MTTEKIMIVAVRHIEPTQLLIMKKNSTHARERKPKTLEMSEIVVLVSGGSCHVNDSDNWEEIVTVYAHYIKPDWTLIVKENLIQPRSANRRFWGPAACRCPDLSDHATRTTVMSTKTIMIVTANYGEPNQPSIMKKDSTQTRKRNPRL
ncbi:hypothetical protein QAD02_009381 [Eretmocerus hayati]|uniref:Uncharacterized protein n=1 Tax=Eretmocerus hayati TaxID=131215 RepID=A0ACC2N9B8_9HYME|nr:hypothetical protein QAD02_009381 [Eretmocerus hayati]